MSRRALELVGLALVLAACASGAVRPGPAAGPIPADAGGAAGYQHGVERSRFVAGPSPRRLNEFGFFKVVGSEGTFAVDMANGVAIAIPHARSSDAQKTVWYTREANAHNQQVLEYFVAAGIPKEQIGGVHATTSLAGSGGETDARVRQPRVGGYQSMLERRIGDIPVADSVAWARMNDAGQVVAEWVYWPAIPARAIADARRLKDQVGSESARGAFLGRLPPNLPPGQVVIRHSSATVTAPFEVFASYDVVELRVGAKTATLDRSAAASRVASVVRHFDADGNERKLPQELRNLEKPPEGAGPRR